MQMVVRLSRYGRTHIRWALMPKSALCHTKQRKLSRKSSMLSLRIDLGLRQSVDSLLLIFRILSNKRLKVCHVVDVVCVCLLCLSPLSVSMSVYLSLCLSVSVSLPLCLYVSLSLCLSASMCHCLFISFPVLIF
jgi:hypothetical protein